MTHTTDPNTGITFCDCCGEAAPGLEDCRCAHQMCDNCAGDEPDDLDRREIDTLNALNRLQAS